MNVDINSKTKKILAYAVIISAVISNTCWGIDLLSNTNSWRTGGAIFSNNVMLLSSAKRVVAYNNNLDFQTGQIYELEVEYNWKGEKGKKDSDFYIDLCVRNGWDGNQYNFIPPNSLRRNGNHYYEVLFNPSELPGNISLRIVKMGKANIEISKLEIKSVKGIDLLYKSYKRKLKKNIVALVMVAWFLFQMAFLLVVVKLQYKPKSGNNRSEFIFYKQRKYVLFFIFGLIIICSIAGSLKLRYNFLLSKNVSLNLLKQQWRSVEMEGEKGEVKNVSVSKAPDNMKGSYWLDVTINIPTSIRKKDEEFIVDFFGEDYDSGSSKIHIPISDKNQSHLKKKSLLKFNNAPSNLYIMIYSTYNTGVELEKLALKKRPSWRELFLF